MPTSTDKQAPVQRSRDREGGPVPSPEGGGTGPALTAPAGLADDLIDELLEQAGGPGKVSGPDGLLAQLTKRVVERAMHAELDDHLGYPKGVQALAGNARNGTTPKTLLTEHGPVQIDRPRDRNGTFEPQIVAKHQRRFEGFDDKIIALYARGMTVRDIRAHLAEIYHTDVSPDLISTVTDAVIEDAKAWQRRPVEQVYAIVYLDALVVKIRDQGAVRNKVCYLAIGVTLEGEREVLGMWFQQTEGAKFWLQVLNELKQRGLADVLVCCVDGLKGFPEAIEAVYPQAWVQTCIVHMIRNSLRFVGYKLKREVAGDLKRIYNADDVDAATDALEEFASKWDERYPMIAQSWRDNREHVIPFLAFPEGVRRCIYTTNTIENLNRQIRKTIKTRGHFPTEDAARKLIYLAIRNAEDPMRDVHSWNEKLAAFKIHFGDRLPH